MDTEDSDNAGSISYTPMNTTNSSDLPADSQHEELESLRDFHEKILQFLHILCNYDIKTPANLIRTYADLMSRFPDFNQNPVLNLKTLKYASQDIFDVIDTVIAVAYWERERERLVGSVSITAVDLAPIFARHIAYMRERITYDNEMFQQEREIAQHNSNFIIGHDIVATSLVINIPDSLPKAHADERLTEQIVETLVRIALKEPLKREVRMEVGFDDRHIFTTIGWIGSGPLKHLVEMFQEFRVARTGFRFNERGLGLYLCWQLAGLQDGELHFEIHDETTHLITLTLLRAAQPGVAADAA